MFYHCLNTSKDSPETTMRNQAPGKGKVALHVSLTLACTYDMYMCARPWLTLQNSLPAVRGSACVCGWELRGHAGVPSLPAIPPAPNTQARGHCVERGPSSLP